MSQSPNRVNAVGEKVIGGAMETAGVLKNALSGDDSLKERGIQKQQDADAEYQKSQAADKADATKDEVKGDVKDAKSQV